MEECKIKNLYNLNETIAKELLEKSTYPWEVLQEIEKYILEIGKNLDEEEYDKLRNQHGNQLADIIPENPSAFLPQTGKEFRQGQGIEHIIPKPCAERHVPSAPIIGN